MPPSVIIVENKCLDQLLVLDIIAPTPLLAEIQKTLFKKRIIIMSRNHWCDYPETPCSLCAPDDGKKIFDKPETGVVSIVVSVEDAKWWVAKGYNDNIPTLGRITSACRKALELTATDNNN